MFIITSKIKYVLIGLGFIFSLIALLVSCLNTGTNTETVYKYDKYLKAPPDIRVLLQKDVKETEIEISHPYSISDLDSNKILASRTNLPKSVIFLKSGEFRIRPQASHSTSETSTTFVKTNSNVGIISDNGFIKIDKSKYRGKLILVPQNKDRFSVLEEIGIEEYLPGVIEGEMPTLWKDDAIQAQVIAARTYAIYQKKIKNDALYHINKLDLAYNGSYNYQPKTKEIVDKSRGTVMVYNWELFPGYFHSTCGGHTEDVNTVFNLRSIPPLSGVDCGYCNKSKYYNWKTNLKKDKIERKLNNAKYNVKKITKIVTEKDWAGWSCLYN